MIHLKTPEEIEIMREGGKRLMAVVTELVPMIKEGVTTKEIDNKAEELLIKNGTTPSFKRVKGYKWSTCLPINEQIVHTPPSERVIKSGDVVTLDIGAFYKGFHTDYADTVLVGEGDDKKKKFLEVGQRTLEKALQKAILDNHIGDISQVIQEEIYGNGYKILRELTGHGVGKELHEDPFVPGYLDRPVEKTYKMPKGLVIAIEIIYSVSSERIGYEDDNWSIITSDRSLSACFEKTVAIIDKNTCILT